MYRADAGAYRHGGATAGYTADAFFNPKDDYAAVVLSNTGPGAMSSADITGEHIRQRFAGLPAISIASVSIPAHGGFLGLIRLFAVYWFTMLASGAFIFCCVLAVQGLAAQLLPRRLFLRISAFLQLAAVGLFVSVYFLQPMLAMPSTILDAQSQGPPAWSPSYWFLGLFQQLNGSPALAPLATRAWIALALALGGTAAAYALSYFRTLRKIAEEPDIVAGARSANWLPGFGTSPQTAICAIQYPDAAPQPPAPRGIGFLSRNRTGLHDFLPEKPGCPANFERLHGRPVAPTGHAVARRKHSVNGLLCIRHARGVFPAIRFAGELDFPNSAPARRSGVSRCAPPFLARALRSSRLPGLRPAVSIHLALARGVSPPCRPRTAGRDSK
jgi:hypothetical protein